MTETTQVTDNQELYSIAQLSKKLHSDRRTIGKYVVGIPAALDGKVKRYPLQAVLDAIAANRSPKQTQNLKNEKIRLECERLKVALQRERGELIPLADVCEQILLHTGRIKSILCQRIVNELPAKAQGLDVPALRGICELALNDALRDYQLFCDGLIAKNAAVEAAKHS